MSQIANFYLVEDGQQKELTDGGCSAEVYMAIWDYCEGELDMDGCFEIVETEDIFDCIKLDSEMAAKLLTALAQDLNELVDKIAFDWDLPTQMVLIGLETIISHLKQVKNDTSLLYEIV